MASARSSLNQVLADLTAPSTTRCTRCHAELQGLTVTTADIDQAYEKVSPSEVLVAWVFIAVALQQVCQAACVSVRKCRAFIYKVGGEAPVQMWWRLSLAELTTALSAFLFLNFATLGDLTFEGAGIPIGGVCSTSCLVLALAFAERQWRSSPKKWQDAGFSFPGSGLDSHGR